MSSPTLHASDDLADPSADRMHRPGVVVVGGGYAGLHAARAAADAGVDVTIVDPDREHDHVTRLAAVAGGTAPPWRATTPFEDFGHELVVGRVETIRDGEVRLDDGRVVSADAVVVSAGAVPTQPPIDGIELAATLRTSADALALRESIDAAGRLVIIGGGATGVQLAGSASSAHPDLDVVLVEAADRLLTPMSEATAEGAHRILVDRGVRLHFGTGVERIDADGVEFDGGRIDGVVVWAGGFEARADGLGVDVSGDGRILVDDCLRIMGMERTFAAGDVAAHLDDERAFLPLSAQIAVQAGRAAGANAAAVVTGDDLRRPTLAQRGWVLDLGGRRGLAEFGPVALTGPFADLLPPLLHDAIDVKTEIGERGLVALPGAVADLVRV